MQDAGIMNVVQSNGMNGINGTLTFVQHGQQAVQNIHENAEQSVQNLKDIIKVCMIRH